MGNSFVAPVEPFQNGDISHFVVAPSGVKGNFTFVGQKIDSPLMQTIFKFIQQYSKKQIEMKSMPEEEWVVKISLKEQIWHNFKDSFRQRVLWTQLFKACHQHGFKPLMNTKARLGTRNTKMLPHTITQFRLHSVDYNNTVQ